MKLLGLTGGVGMGKSVCEQVFQRLGIPTIDTDTLARRVVEPGQPALDEVRKAFGPEVIAEDGSLRRGALAEKVFSDPAARATLEQLLHPRIRELWKQQANHWKSEGRPVSVVVIPLLFETNAASEFDATVCVACSRSTQISRLSGRGWSSKQIEERIAAQWPIEEKMKLSDYVIWNEAGLDVLEAQVKEVLARLRSRRGNEAGR